MEKNIIEVIVDDREIHSQVLINLQTYHQLHITTRRLPLGDYQFADKLIIDGIGEKTADRITVGDKRT